MADEFARPAAEGADPADAVQDEYRWDTSLSHMTMSQGRGARPLSYSIHAVQSYVMSPERIFGEWVSIYIPLVIADVWCRRP